MKPAKFIALILSVVMAAGCTVDNPAGLPSNTTDTSTDTQNEITTEEQIPLNIPTDAEDDISDAEDDTSNAHKVFERVSYENLSEAEQIYKSLHSFAEFKHYLRYEAAKDLDVEDVVYIEKLHLPRAGLDDKAIGTSYTVAYYRIAEGIMSNGVDLTTWVDSFASGVYTAQELSEFFDRNIAVSDGKIYIFQYAYGNDDGWLTTSGLTLDEITAVNDYTIQLY